MTDEATNRILEEIDEGILDRDSVIMACLKYMSESEVEDMAQHNGFWECDEEPEPEEDEDQADDDEGLATDCE